MSKYKRLTSDTGFARNLPINEELYDRLYELENAIENGTLIELPCKVGDTVYEVFKNHKPPFGRATTIEKIIITDKGLRLKLSRNSVYETAISSLGETLFLTEAEAIAKLDSLKNETIEPSLPKGEVAEPSEQKESKGNDKPDPITGCYYCEDFEYEKFGWGHCFRYDRRINYYKPCEECKGAMKW